MDPSMMIAASAMAVTVIGALAAAVVTVMKGFADMRIQINGIEKTASDIHAVVNGSASALREQNERATTEAIRVATANTVEASRVSQDAIDAAYARGLADAPVKDKK